MKRALVLCCLVILLSGCANPGKVFDAVLRGGRSEVPEPPRPSRRLEESERRLGDWWARLARKIHDEGVQVGAAAVEQWEHSVRAWLAWKGLPERQLPLREDLAETEPEVEAETEAMRDQIVDLQQRKTEHDEVIEELAAEPVEKRITISSGTVAWIVTSAGAGFAFLVGTGVFHWIRKRAMAAKFALVDVALKQTVGAIQHFKKSRPALYNDGTDKSLRAELTAAHDARSSALIDAIRRP